nr:ABC transporter ATP-binding protein [Microbispora sp. GKU 823]
MLVDGTDLAGLDLDEWRRRLAFVPQRPHLFATSVADNIALGSAAGPEEVRAAAEAAQVAEFAAALPQGYDTPLGERGANLSAGQRQRVAWPGPSAAPPPGCCCWTSPRRGSTAGARRRSWRPRAGWRRAVRRSSSRTARR